jgi:hypothetical protein
MKNTFQYSLLRYVHSQIIDERVNIGIILYFPSFHKLIFRHPKGIAKFKSIYRSFPEKAIKTYLKSFEESANRIDQSFVEENLDNILSEFFLIKESATLQFSETREVLQYSDDWETISEQYFRLYFPEEFPLENEDVTKPIRNLLLK